MAVPATALILLFTLATPVVADHPQSVDGATFVFDHRTGNEWWVEAFVDVDGSQPDEVFARHSGSSTWNGLTLRDWGAWAGSFHIPSGNLVQFRALSGGTEAESCLFTHPGGVEQCEEPAFDADFRTPGGNEWWVEVYVSANKPLGSVFARVDGGHTWHELTLRDWGAWAASFHVPEGSLVDFLARTEASGESDVSDKYVWTEGHRFPAVFAPKASNEWWVETLAIGGAEIVAVDARVDGGSWRSLTLREWGAWAASIHAPEGSLVEFRGTGTDGQRDVSPAFLWPDAVPASDPDGAWPQEGSYVRFDVFESDPAPSTVRTVGTLVFHDGAWLEHCVGERDDPGPSPHPVFSLRPDEPPHFGPTDVAPGDEVDFGGLDVCGSAATFSDMIVEEASTYDARREGGSVTLATWFSDRIEEECRCIEWEVEWDQASGMIVFFDQSGRETERASLDDTDAPIGTG